MKSRILLVEDNKDDALWLSDVIQLVKQHSVTVAQEGLQAIQLARHDTFDLVLLDLYLPDTKGWDVAKALRQMENWHDVPIISMTAYDIGQTRSLCFQAGCNWYFVKPVDIDRLVDIISKHLPPVA